MTKAKAVVPAEKSGAPQLDKLAWINDQLRQALDEDQRLDEIISGGVQYKTTATGWPALIFETCTCKTYADRRKDHAEDCEVKAVTDPGPIVAAMREKRLNRNQVAVLLKLRDEIQPVNQDAEIKEITDYIDGLCNEVDGLKRENSHLRVQLAQALSEPVMP